MRKAKNKRRPRKKKQKTKPTYAELQDAFVKLREWELLGGMSSSAVAPIKRPRNFQTPTADASIVPLLLINLITIAGPAERLGGTASASPHVGTRSLDTRPEKFSTPFLRHTWQPFVCSVLSLAQPGRKSLDISAVESTFGVEGFPNVVAEGNLQRSD